MKALAFALLIVGLFGIATPVHAGFDATDQEREQRWKDLQSQVFQGKQITRDDKAVQLDAPDRALDAALVPVSLNVAEPASVKALYLIIDDNPSPVAAHILFGPAALPKVFKLRVRINTYTNVHAVLETRDGRFLETRKLIKASGGCSAPMGVSDEEAMRGMGEMRLKLGGDVEAGKPVGATLMIRHPNFNGMQANPVTRDYTPARYIQTINLRLDDKSVFDLESDISLASNPVVNFELLPGSSHGRLQATVTDSQNQTWTKSFDVPFAAN